MAAQGSTYTPVFARSGSGIVTIVDIAETPGSVYFVNSATGTNGTGYGRKPDAPLASLSYAYSSDLVTAGDVVYVMPGHSENISSAGAITADIAGVTVIGLGTGAARPTFNSTTTDATILITAANTKWVNLLHVANTAVDVVQGILVTGADCTLIDIEGREDGTTKQFVDWLTVHTGADRCKIVRPKFIGAAGDAGQSGIQVTAVANEVVIDDAWVEGTLAAGCIETTAANLRMLVRNSVTRNAHATQDGGIVLGASTTGMIINPVTRSATNDADGFNLAFVGAAAAWFNPLVVNLAGEKGGSSLTASAAA